MELGVANFDLKTLEADPEQEHVQSTVTLQGKDRGVLNYAINYYPTMTPKKLENGSEEAIPETSESQIYATFIAWAMTPSHSYWNCAIDYSSGKRARPQEVHLSQSAQPICQTVLAT